MREIKFRGKRTDNSEWVFGFLVVDTKGKYRIYMPAFDGAESMTYFFVIPESVGQYIGFKDKNGKEIFEGDLISEKGSSPYEVIWQYHAATWIMQSFQKGRYYREMAYDYAQRDYEVIGHICEHPELIKIKNPELIK